jgi:hypothetical protein
MDTDAKALFIRVYRRESVVPLLWLRLAALDRQHFFWNRPGFVCNLISAWGECLMAIRRGGPQNEGAKAWHLRKP